MVMYVTTDQDMSGMKMAMLINKYRESFYPDYPSMLFDFRGACADICFPETTDGFTHMFGNSVSLQKIKVWGHEYRWRISAKRNGNASVHFRIYHKGEKFAYHFKKKGFNNLRTLEEIIEELATPENYVGLFPEVEPSVVIHKRIVNELKTTSTVELLEEVNRRYKEEMPDWASAINPPSNPTENELAAILAA